MYIQIKTTEKQLFFDYYSTSLNVIINENYGQMKVLDKDNKP